MVNEKLIISRFKFKFYTLGHHISGTCERQKRKRHCTPGADYPRWGCRNRSAVAAKIQTDL